MQVVLHISRWATLAEDPVRPPGPLADHVLLYLYCAAPSPLTMGAWTRTVRHVMCMSSCSEARLRWYMCAFRRGRRSLSPQPHPAYSSSAAYADARRGMLPNLCCLSARLILYQKLLQCSPCADCQYAMRHADWDYSWPKGQPPESQRSISGGPADSRLHRVSKWDARPRLDETAQAPDRPPAQIAGSHSGEPTRPKHCG